MIIRLLALLVLFSASCAYAHPNHMGFEDIQHEQRQSQNKLAAIEKLSHHVVPEKPGHNEIAPCREQHKAMPCERKR